MARAEYGYPPWVFLHPGECDIPGDIYAGLGWTGTGNPPYVFSIRKEYII